MTQIILCQSQDPLQSEASPWFFFLLIFNYKQKFIVSVLMGPFIAGFFIKMRILQDKWMMRLFQDFAG